jgi:nicotinamidase-related amidase
LEKNKKKNEIMSASLEDVLASKKTAVVVVDFQKDFMEGGALAVPGANYDKYKASCVKIIDKLREKGVVKITWSQDWHPPGHSSFASANGSDPFVEKRLTRKREDDSIDEYAQVKAG